MSREIHKSEQKMDLQVQFFCGCSVNALSVHAVRVIVQRGFVVVEEIKCTKYLEEEVEPGELPKALTPHFSTLL